MVNFWNSFIVLVFILLYILDGALRECFVEIPIGVWVKTLISKNAYWPLTQNLLDFISTLALLLVLAVQFLNVSPITGRSCGSISTSLHTSATRFAVKSRRSLCLIVMNPPFLQLIACWMSILDRLLHVDRMFVNLQP